MERLSFLADEHVPNVVLSALRSNGYDSESAKAHLTEGAEDVELLETATDLGRGLLTNDRDFVRFGAGHEHPGILVYVAQEPAPGPFVRAIRRLDRYFTPKSMENNIEWLEDWLPRS